MVTWTLDAGVIGVTDFLVQWKAGTDVVWAEATVPFAEASVPETSGGFAYKITGLTSATSYDFRVTALNGVTPIGGGPVEEGTFMTTELPAFKVINEAWSLSVWSQSEYGGAAYSAEMVLIPHSGGTAGMWLRYFLPSETIDTVNAVEDLALLKAALEKDPSITRIMHGDTLPQSNWYLWVKVCDEEFLYSPFLENGNLLITGGVPGDKMYVTIVEIVTNGSDVDVILGNEGAFDVVTVPSLPPWDTGNLDTLTGEVSQDGETITVTWDKVADADGYEVQRWSAPVSDDPSLLDAPFGWKGFGKFETSYKSFSGEYIELTMKVVNHDYDLSKYRLYYLPDPENPASAVELRWAVNYVGEDITYEDTEFSFLITSVSASNPHDSLPPSGSYTFYMKYVGTYNDYTGITDTATMTVPDTRWIPLSWDEIADEGDSFKYEQQGDPETIYRYQVRAYKTVEGVKIYSVPVTTLITTPPEA